MQIRDLTLAQMQPTAVFERCVLKLLHDIAARDGMAGIEQVPTALLLDLYGYELSYEKLIEAFYSYVEGTGAGSLFARQGSAYATFMAEQQAWLDLLFADRPRRKKSQLPREENTLVEFFNDFTTSIQWDVGGTQMEQYGNQYHRVDKYILERAAVFKEIPEQLFVLVLNVIDITIHHRAEEVGATDPLPAAAVEWVDNLFAWFITIYRWHDIALAALKA